MHFQRVGLLLGLVAWCMQLIIFVQPFLPGGTMSGLGVCQTVVQAFSDQQPHHAIENKAVKKHDAIYNKNNVNQQDRPHSHHAMVSGVNDYPLTQHIQPIPTQVDHHFSHLACGFCVLFGHAVPPPAPTPAWSQAEKRPFITLAAFAGSIESVIPSDYIKPKSRAPPIIFSL